MDATGSPANSGMQFLLNGRQLRGIFPYGSHELGNRSKTARRTFPLRLFASLTFPAMHFSSNDYHHMAYFTSDRKEMLSLHPARPMWSSPCQEGCDSLMGLPRTIGVPRLASTLCHSILPKSPVHISFCDAECERRCYLKPAHNLRAIDARISHYGGLCAHWSTTALRVEDLTLACLGHPLIREP